MRCSTTLLVTADSWHTYSAYTGSLYTQAIELFAPRKREFCLYHRQRVKLHHWPAMTSRLLQRF